MAARPKRRPTKVRASAPDPIDVAVGARIRLKRIELGLSQGSLADALGLSFQQVQKYERGNNRISASMLVKAAAHLNVPASSLLGEGEGDVGHPNPALSLLSQPGTAFFLATYCKLSPRERQAVRVLAQSLAGDDPVSDTAAPEPASSPKGSPRSHRQSGSRSKFPDFA